LNLVDAPRGHLGLRGEGKNSLRFYKAPLAWGIAGKARQTGRAETSGLVRNEDLREEPFRLFLWVSGELR
jgi:hypothetical protein